MNKTYKTYLVLLGVLFVILAVLELNKKPVIDWTTNYDINKKSPFGLYIFNQEADKLFDNNLERATENPYLYLEKDTLRKPQNYLLIQKDITKEAENYLLKEVEKGSSVFYILNKKRHSYHYQYHYPFSDTLNFIAYDYRHFNDSVNFYFTNKKLKDNSIHFKENFNHMIFKKINTKTTQILGYKKDNDSKDKQAVFIKVKYGKGSFYFFLSLYY